jgi:ATP/maltotriose-dependent transcriptional regulator MalT
LTRPNDLLLDGLVTRTVAGFAAGASPLRDAVSAFRLDDGGDVTVDRWLWLACRIAADLFDHDAWDVLASRAVRLAREAGALSVLPLAASYRAGVHMHAGEYALASALMEESESISTATGSAPLIATVPMLLAYRGDEPQTIRWIEAAERDATSRGQGMALSMIGCAHAVLLNGLGRYEEAFHAAERACDRDELSLFALAHVELIEAGVRCGRPGDATEGLRRLSERTRASGTDWALGLEARSRALLADDSAADYEEAVERLGRTRLAPHRARTQLVFGEWLRRENRITEARDQLRAAYDTFAHIGAQAFAERARRELAATGETVRSRSVDTVNHLTAREDQIARLAASGRTNPEIGSELFISARTVEYHLAKVFTKLGIASRRELQRSLPAFDPMA